MRDAVFDTYQRLMPRSRASAPAVIVAIDERALDARGQWPWPRTLMAELLRAILAAGPAAVGVDLFFAEPDRASPAGDAALAEAIEGEKVVLGIAGLEYRDRRFPFPPSAAPVRIAAKRELALRRYDGQLQSRPEISRAAAGRGLLSSDAKGVVRRVPLIARIGQVLVPSLSVEMIRVAIDAPLLGLTDRGGEHLELGIGNVSVPLQSDGSMYLYFGHEDGERFVSAEQILSGSVPADVLRDKLVLVGITGLGLLDYQVTPLGERIPGVEVHAQLIEQMYDGNYLRRPTGATWLEAALLLTAGALLVLWVPTVRPWMSASLLAAVLAVLVALGLAAFRAGYLVDVAAPAIGAAVLFAGLLASTLAEADQQRRLLREAQARVAGELEAARRIQMGLLPAPRELFAYERRFTLDAHLEPARTVGGDFYDCFMLDGERLFFLVGDVSGKGLGASLFMALAKSLVKSIALRGDGGDPAEVLRAANAEIGRDNPESLFVTVFAAVLDARTGRMRYCNAGHEPPVLCQPGEAPQRLADCAGPPLCVIADFPYASGELALAPDGWLCAVSDGVTEAMNPRGELYGAPRLLAALTASGSREPQAVLAAVREDVRRYAAGAEQSDDVTLVCVRLESR
ncbi:MAG: CHASE2 domain-containing protein [Betaproteobacteria bacterium]|nr:MAG: CHASE2 domain-containing protein [Betaproteobacteria bacterium]